MAIGLRTNLGSLRAIGAIERATGAISKSFARLSSGSRINHASDDPAGLAMSSALQMETRVLNRGRMNISDGVSALEIADASLEQTGTLLRRMAELAEQAANGSLGLTQRRTLQAEYSQLDAEIRRISGTTTFNGISLLQGDKSSRTASTNVATTSSSVAAISGDGRYMTYRAANGALMQKDLVTGTDTTIVSDANPTNVVVSGSGDQILFSSTKDINGLNSTSRAALYVYSKGTQTISKVVTAGVGDTLDATLSADGTTLAFKANHTYDSAGNSLGAASGPSIHTLNLTAGGITLATTLSSSDSYSALSLSQNGSYLAFSTTTFTDQGYANILNLSSPGGSLTTVLSGSGASTTSLQISNSGVAYFLGDGSVGDGTPSIYSIRSGGSTVTKAVGLEVASTLGAYRLSNDGSFITFISTSNTTGENSGNASQIFEYDLATGKTTQKTSLTGAAVGSILGFSSDGNTAYRLSGSNILTYDVSRSGLNVSLDTGLGRGTNAVISNSISATFGYLRGLGALSVASQASARGTLDAVRRNIDLLNDIRGTIGAGVSRLEVSHRVVGSSSEETTAAHSRIRDADIADESAQLIKNQAIQKAAVSILAQANLQSRMAMKLLES